MAFKTIHTNYGLAKLSAAEAQGAVINLPTMAVGDGGGNPVDPDANQTQLVRERYRAAVNRVYQDPVNPAKFSAELVIPASIGGFTLREVGVFDSAGSLFVVGNLPETYKPNDSDGAFSDTVIRVDFIVSNAATIELIADPNVVIVTRQWISNNVTAKQLIPGGTTGQVLSKASNEDGAYVWTDPGVATVIVDVLEERQTLAADQTTVTWSIVSTRGLAVYIDGARVNKGPGVDQWQDSVGSPELSIVLGRSYPAGTKILGVQNNPAGAVPYPLVRGQNLADVPDKPLARANMGIYSKEEVDAKVPAGAILHFARTTAPPGWLKCNGSAISRVAYADLFAAIGTTFGSGDGFTTFNLPDLRGEFIRGWDDGRGVDGGRAFGSAQAGAIQSHDHAGSSASAGSHAHSGTAASGGSHSHNGSTSSNGSHSHTYGVTRSGGVGAASGSGYTNQSENTSTAGSHSHSVSIGTSGEHTHTLSISSGGAHAHAITIDATGGAETRPRNIAFLACIRF